jgi:hypothetical protein
MRAALRHVVLGGHGHGGGDAGQHGRIHIDGLVFRDEQGAIWPWKGFTAFTLYLLWLIGKGAAVDQPVSDWLSLRHRPNTLRVLGMVNSFARLHPQDWTGYYDELQPFVRYLFSKWAIRVEFVIFADSGDIMPDAGQQNDHARRVADLIGDEPNVFLEVANEPSQHSNLSGGDERAYEIYHMIKRADRMVATGAGDGSFSGDFVTVHTPRDLEWPRKAKDILDVRDIAHDPSVADEPMGASEVWQEGKRDTNPRNFADYAAVAQLVGAGSTFHSDSGILARPLQPIQRECAEAFFAAADWVPSPAQIEIFNRGGTVPGCNWTHAPGDAESPCQHDDSIEVRSYGKILEPFYYVSQVQTKRDQPKACAGWQADQSGPSTGLTRFRRA